MDQLVVSQTLLKNTGFTNIGLFHIDLDGNDYHILEAIDLTEVNPSIIIMEYNSVFGSVIKQSHTEC